MHIQQQTTVNTSLQIELLQQKFDNLISTLSSLQDSDKQAIVAKISEKHNTLLNRLSKANLSYTAATINIL